MFILVAFFMDAGQPTFFQITPPLSYEECREERQVWKPIIRKGVELECVRQEAL